MLLTRSLFNRSLLRSDLRRCWPLFAGYTFLWFLILPLRLWNDIPAGTLAGDVDAAKRVTLETIGTATSCAIWINLIFGIVLAMALFSYLSSSRATYGMHSFPASRACQFGTHVLCGIGGAVCCSAIIFLLTMLPQSAAACWGPTLSWLAFSLVTFLLFFALGVVCCMLCAWLPAMAVAFGALNCAALLCRVLMDSMCSLFYLSYKDNVFSMGRDNIVVWLTPALRLALDLKETYADGSDALLTHAAWRSLLVYGIAALVLLAASRLLYGIRRSEASGDTLAFRPLRPVVRWVVGLLGGLGLGLLLALILSCTSNTVALLACIIVLGLACMIGSQMLIARTPRVFGKLWPELLALCAVLIALCLCVKADLFGFERRVPQADQVESAEIVCGALAHRPAQFDSPDEIDTILLVHHALADRTIPKGGYTEYGRSFLITYNLKDGGRLSRQYYLPTSDMAIVQPLLETDTFRRSLVLDSAGTVSAESLRYGWVSIPTAEVSRELTAQQCNALYKATLEDIAAMDMTDTSLYSNQNCLVQIILDDTVHDREFSIYLNRQCTRTLALLQEWDIIQTPEDAFGIDDMGDYAGTIEYPGITVPYSA